MTGNILDEYRKTWQQKPVPRAIYTDFYARIIAACHPRQSLEVGGGSGNLKNFIDSVISTDIVLTPWLDAAADVQALPFSTASFVNIVAVDVLHHIKRPRRFLAEAERVLQPGGRLILLEPAITPISWIFYRFFHPEPVMLRVNPLADGPLDPDRKPFDANQAIPPLLFGRYRQQLKQEFPSFRIVQLERLSLLAYPLSGGFRSWGLIPAASIQILLNIERALTPIIIIGCLMVFRFFVVLEKLSDVELQASDSI